ncbi:MAG: 50S ribosomal protein L11 methyltransferase [Xanthobacteraceae bacterium]|nr:50S ribosomal protein L11 methyltransferase [Xanthobacteraceae bacterium]
MSRPAEKTILARLACDERTATAIADAIAEGFPAGEVAVAAFETAGGGWSMEAYFSDPPDEPVLRALVAGIAGARAGAALVFAEVAAEDWVARSLAGLAPVVAGRFVVHGAHDRARIRPNQQGIEIEAALAFGTGHHGTTRGCLLALDRLAKRRGFRRVLDVGTGTGVLAIGAYRAFRRPVLASDIDGRAVEIARANARLNRAAVAVVHAGGLGVRRIRAGAPFDLVFANILLGPLTRLARPLRGLLAPGARVVLSGLLTAHAAAALAAYRSQGLALEDRITLEGWTTLILRRGPPLNGLAPGAAAPGARESGSAGPVSRAA